MNTDRIAELVVTLSESPFDPINNFNIALEYESVGQLASAVSFYLRTAEYGYDTHPEYVYASLMKIAHCFEVQKWRMHSVQGSLLQAIAYMPYRPEAWFFLSRFHERAGNWQEAYTFAETGIKTWDPEDEALPCETDFKGLFCLEFEKAVASWWIGRRDESIELLQYLNRLPLPPEYADAVRSNLERLSITQ